MLVKNCYEYINTTSLLILVTLNRLARWEKYQWFLTQEDVSILFCLKLFDDRP